MTLDRLTAFDMEHGRIRAFRCWLSYREHSSEFLGA
jgi:hypothetical protein